MEDTEGRLGWLLSFTVWVANILTRGQQAQIMKQNKTNPKSKNKKPTPQQTLNMHRPDKDIRLPTTDPANFRNAAMLTG